MLVQEDQLGISDKGLGQPQTLLHPFGVLGHPADPRRPYPDQVEEAVGVDRDSGQAPVELQELAAGEPPGEAEELGEVSHPLLHLSAPGRASQHHDLALAPVHEAGEDLHQGRLARPVRAEEPEHAPGLHVEAHPGQGDRRAVALAHVVAVDGEGHVGHGTTTSPAGFLTDGGGARSSSMTPLDS